MSTGKTHSLKSGGSVTVAPEGAGVVVTVVKGLAVLAVEISVAEAKAALETMKEVVEHLDEKGA